MEYSGETGREVACREQLRAKTDRIEQGHAGTRTADYNPRSKAEGQAKTERNSKGAPDSENQATEANQRSKRGGYNPRSKAERQGRPERGTKGVTTTEANQRSKRGVYKGAPD